jgi:hypothetical protein
MTFAAGVAIGALTAMAVGWSIDWFLRRSERRFIDQLLTMTAEAHASLAEACRGLVGHYTETQELVPHRFGEIELRKKMLTDCTSWAQTRADLLQEAARRPVSHARAKELIAQAETTSDRLNGWGIE